MAFNRQKSALLSSLVNFNEEIEMQNDVVLTCAVTGAGNTTGKSAHVPVTPKEIATAAIDAAKAGASIAHIHARDPETGVGSRDPKLFKEIVDRVRDSNTDIVINITAGMGGDMVFGSVDNPLPYSENGTDMAGADERVQHLVECLPEICTLDCGTMNFAEADYVLTNTPGLLQAMGSIMTEAGVKPELEGVNQDELEEREGIYYFKDSDTPYTGKVYGLYENGQKKSEGNYKDGKRDGLSLEWYKKGQKKRETNYKDGKKDGLSIFWLANGQKGNEGIYKDGITEGIHKMWHANGQMRVQAKFENGIGSANFWNSKGESVNSFEETGLNNP